jgi:hypothetical protein
MCDIEKDLACFTEEQENEMIKNRLDIYFSLKSQLKCNIAIVGSFALYLQGFKKFICPAKDLDLALINPNKEDIDIMENLLRLTPNKKIIF